MFRLLHCFPPRFGSGVSGRPGCASRVAVRGRAGRRDGFALVEVLAALVVTGALVAVVLPFAVRLVERWSAGQASIEAADAWMRGLARLGDDVSQAVPVLVPEDGQTRVLFHVAPDQVEFVRPALVGSPRTGLETVTYRLEGDGQRQKLVRRARPFSATGTEDLASQDIQSTVLEGPYRLRFSVAGPSGNRSDTWEVGNALPVQLELAMTGPTAALPPMRVALPLGTRFKGMQTAPSNNAPTIARSAGNRSGRF